MSLRPRILSMRTVLKALAQNIIAWVLSNTAQTTKPATKVKLYDVNDSLIKVLQGSWGDIVDTGSSIKRKFSATDESTDTYSVKKAVLTTDDEVDEYLRHIEETPVEKPSDQPLIVEWTVEIAYGGS